MAILTYIDETGTSVLEDAEQPILTVVAVLVKEDQVQPLSESMRSLAMRALGWRPLRFEFHGYEIFHGEGHWAPLDQPSLVQAYRDAIGLLERHDISVAFSSINKPKLAERYEAPDSPYLLALQFLCEKIDRIEPEWLKILIADESKEHELPAIDLVADLQSWGSGIVPGPSLTTIIDSLHFVRSQASPGVQLADLVAFIIQRHRLGVDTHPDAIQAVAELRAMVGEATITYRAVWPF